MDLILNPQMLSPNHNVLSYTDIHTYNNIIAYIVKPYHYSPKQAQKHYDYKTGSTSIYYFLKKQKLSNKIHTNYEKQHQKCSCQTLAYIVTWCSKHYKRHVFWNATWFANPIIY